MIDLDEAQGKVIENTPLLPEEEVATFDALGRILAEEVRTYEAIPSFDSSAMDGFVLRRSDLEGASKEHPVGLAVAGEVRAGCLDLPALPLKSALRIFTGAPVPFEGDGIVIQEEAEDLGHEVRVRRVPGEGEHIRRSGAEFSKGSVIFSPGHRITPSTTGMLASLGCLSVKVRQKPRAAIVVTGDELVSCDRRPAPGQVREAGSHALGAALCAMGLDRPRVILARDDRDAVARAFEEAFQETDLVLSTGGVSVGAYDFVKSALSRLKVKTLFWRVAMKPGKPNYFGKRGDQLVFGLPGNTVSSLVSCFVLVRPAIRKMEGRGGQIGLILKARLNGHLRKDDPRLELVRGRLVAGPDRTFSVTPLPGRGSHMLGNLALADCLIYFPKERDTLAHGDFVEVEPLVWSEM